MESHRLSRLAFFLVVLLSVFGPFSAEAADRPGIYQPGGFTFAPSQVLVRPPIPATPGVTLLDQSLEPEVKTDIFGNLYVAAIHGVPGGIDLWKSIDKGATFVYLGQPDGAQDRCNVAGTAPCAGGIGGGDVSMDVSSGGYLYVSSLWLGNVTMSVSMDGGAGGVLPGQKWEVNAASGSVPVEDRQWIAAYGPQTVYMTFDQAPAPGPLWFTKSTDAGKTFSVPIPLVPALELSRENNLVVDPYNGNIYTTYTAAGQPNIIRLLRSTDGGDTWTNHVAHSGAAGTSVENAFPVLAVDRGGNVHLAYTQCNGLTGRTNCHVYLRSSSDQGTTWLDAVRVDTGSGSNSTVMPWIVAGSSGIVNVTWYGSSSSSPDSAPFDWHVYFAQTRDALSPTPTFNQVLVTPTQVHDAAICSRGGGCAAGTRDLTEYYTLTVDPDGIVNVAFVDGTTTCTGNCRAKTWFTKQTSGPSSYAPPAPPPPATFSPNIAVSGQSGTAEPNVWVDSHDCVYVGAIGGPRISLSTDGGATFSTKTVALGAGIHGGDFDIVTLPQASGARPDILYTADLGLSTVHIAKSINRFATFAQPGAGGSAGEVSPSSDRMWLAIDRIGADQHLYLTDHELVSEIIRFSVSTNDQPWVPTSGVTNPELLETHPNTNPGPAFINKTNHEVLSVFAAATITNNASDPPFGKMPNVWTAVGAPPPAAGAPPGPFANYPAFRGLIDSPATAPLGSTTFGNHLGNLFPSAAADSAGNVYVVWTMNHSRPNATLGGAPTSTYDVWMAASRDGGRNYYGPFKVSSGTGTSVMPWIAAGDQGRIAIVWYQSSNVAPPLLANAASPGTLTGGANAMPAGSNWDVMFAQSLNADSREPVFRISKASDHVMHTGSISTGGLTGSSDRSLLDFFEVAIGPDGRAHIAFADNGGGAPIHVTYTRQTGGPLALVSPKVTGCLSDPVSAGTLQLSAAAYSVGEGEGTATITVTRSGGSTGIASVNYATSNGSALSGSDYTAASGTLNWADGDAASKSFTVPITNDALVEGDETVNITLSSATGATLGTPASAVLTIVDNDTGGSPGNLQFSAAAYSVNEGGGSATISATRTGGSSGSVSVSYATSNGTATAGSDYTSSSGSLNWADGDTASKTFTVPISNDTAVESNETVNLTLSAPTGGALLGSPSSAVLTIVDDDSSSGCNANGVTVQTDGAGDQFGGPTANTQLDVRSVSIAEPYVSDAEHSLNFTIKVDNLNGTLQPNSSWTVYFNARDTGGTSRQLFVQMNTSEVPVTTSFGYGWHDPVNNIDLGQCFLNSCPEVTGGSSADGTITIKLITTSTLAFTDIDFNPAFTANLAPVGTALSSIRGSTSILAGAAGTGLIVAADTTAGDGAYSVVGNLACKPNTGTDPNCTAPGTTVVTNSATSSADMQPSHHIISAAVSYPYTGDSVSDRLIFTIKVESLSTLTPSSFYYTSFTIDGKPEAAGNVYGARMVVGETGAVTFQSYLAGASNAGTVDGRFITAATPAESGSRFDPNGTITIIVRPENLGITADGTHTLTAFNGAVAQTAGGVVTAILDSMPSGNDTVSGGPISRANTSFTVRSNQTCKPSDPATHLGVVAPATVPRGGAFTLTVTALTAANATATGYRGTVHFTSSDGAATLPSDYTFTAADAGVRTFTVTLATAGSQTVTATDTANVAITGTATTLVSEILNATTTALTSSPNPSTGGQSVTFTAAVTPFAASGTVTFHEGATQLGSGTLVSGQATFSTSTLSEGSHVITARYGGDASFAPSTSAPITQVVNQSSIQPGAARFDLLMSPPGLGNPWGEPTIGVNWKSERVFSNSAGPIPNGGTIMSFGGFGAGANITNLGATALRVTCSDCASPAEATWEKTADLMMAATPRVYGDPILFTDKDTGRTFVSQLVGLTPTSGTDITDDDGRTFTPSQGSGIASGIDHQTFGGGPFAAPLTRDPNGPVYPNAVYYCSQDLVAALCALSVDGGRTFGPAVPMYTTQCGGAHGHVKVANDGTVYVPNHGCGGTQAVIVSENNGLTWAIRNVTGATFSSGFNDPSVGVASNGTIYFGYQAGNGRARIAVSHDKGVSWINDVDVSGPLGVNYTVFPAVVAGDRDRAAYAFFGTSTAGNTDASVWYLYIATTYDGGLTWRTINATPGDPIQRGVICLGGTGCASGRNLLDFFDATIDKQGRVLVHYDDGCISAACINGGPNDNTAKAAIARQSGGKRMYATFDPVEPGAPKAPAVTANLIGNTNQISWTTPDHSGSAVTSYKVYRRTGPSGSFDLVAAVNGNSFTDTNVAPSTQYSYRVTAVNGVAEGPYCGEASPVLPPPPPDPCHTPGVVAINDVNADGSDIDADQNTPPDGRVNIQRLSIAEPDLGPGVNKLVFTLNVKPNTMMTTAPPSSQWFIIWSRIAPEPAFDRWYVAMKSDAFGAVSFEYGKFGIPTPIGGVPDPNTNQPVRLGDVDSGSYNVATGTITITLSNSKAENIQAGQRLAGLNVRTFFGRPDAGLRNQAIASDITADAIHTLFGNAFCGVQNNRPPVPANDAVTTGQATPVTTNVVANDTDPDNDSLTVTAVTQGANGSVVNAGSGNVTYTPVSTFSGTDSFTYTVSDGRGGSATASVTVTVLAPSTRSILFGHDTLVDFSATSGEPFIEVGPQNTPFADNIYVTVPFGLSTTVSLLWRSIDGAKSFIPLGTPIVRDAVTGPGGGDTHLDFDHKGRLYYVDLSGACVMAAVSEDGGNTFLPHQTNHLTCIGGGDDPAGAQDDRQWVAAFGDGLGYVTVRNLAVSSGGNFHLFRTRDAGLTWDGRILGTVGQSGPLQIDKTKRLVNGKPAILLYQVYTGLNLFRITDLDDGSMPTSVSRPIVSSGNVLFPVLSIDTAGNLYVVWTNGSNVFMRTSVDRGDTWSATRQINPPSMTGTNIMPWIVAGDPGRVDIVWYFTPGGNNASSVWNIYMAQSLNALSAAPTFTVNKVNETIIHRGEICTAGLQCDVDTLTGNPRDRSFLEFPSVDVDSKGAAVITFNDNTNQADGPSRAGAAYVMVTRQTTGPSLYYNVGSVGLDPGSVTITQPSEGQVMSTSSVPASGSHTIPAGGGVTDESGDGNFPDHGAVIGPNVPALDIRKVSMSDNATSLTVTMDIADLTVPSLAAAAAQSGGDGVLYLTQWDFNDKVYWVAAEVRAGVPLFRTGAIGVIKSATSKKYVTYNPDLQQSMQVTGTITNGAPGRITITIPRTLVGSPANGSSIFTTTAYTMSQRGPLLPVGDQQGNPNPSSLPIQVDAAGPFTHIVGGSAVDGKVEVSLDNPAFTTPTTAVAGANGTWTATLSGVTAGAHTLYARQIINGREPSAAALVHFSVNTPPIAVADSATTRRDTPVTINVLANDSDPDGDAITVTAVTQGANGAVTNGGGGAVTYTPQSGFVGDDSFTYTISDVHGATASAAVTISVVQINSAPLAVNDAYATAEDTPLNVAAPGVLANDSDPDGDALSATVVSGPLHGTLTLQGNGSFTYTPAADYNGGDSFSYKAMDSALDSNVAVVAITISAVNDAPSATADSASTSEDSPVTVNVLANDSTGPANENGQSLSVSSASAPAHGTATVNADNSITYTPAADSNGPDSFTYTACDNGTTNGAADSKCATATVSISVSEVNDAPSAANDSATTAEDTPVTINVLANDSAGPADENGQSLSVSSTSAPAHGTATINADQSITYTPAANFNGPDGFSYSVCDNGTTGGAADAKCSSASVLVAVFEVNDEPQVSDDAATTAEDTAATISVLSNDSAGPAEAGQSLTVTAVTAPAHGTATVNPDNTITYTPAANYNGADSFNYTACDNGTTNGAADSKCGSAAVAVTITAVNDAPVANNDAYSTKPSHALAVGAPGVLANDSDIDSASLTAKLVSGASNGVVTLQSDGSFVYTPEAGFQGTDSFTYQANDGQADSNVGTVTITVDPKSGKKIKMTGAGEVQTFNPDGTGSFGFNIRRDLDDGAPAGSLNYYNAARNLTVQSVSITSLNESATSATFSGSCTKNGAPCTFTATIEDNGEPGHGVDRFTIAVSGEPVEGGAAPISSGNVQIK